MHLTRNVKPIKTRVLHNFAQTRPMYRISNFFKNAETRSSSPPPPPPHCREIEIERERFCGIWVCENKSIFFSCIYIFALYRIYIYIFISIQIESSYRTTFTISIFFYLVLGFSYIRSSRERGRSFEIHCFEVYSDHIYWDYRLFQYIQ